MDTKKLAKALAKRANYRAGHREPRDLDWIVGGAGSARSRKPKRRKGLRGLIAGVLESLVRRLIRR
jgi:hypothetical protein